MTFITDSRERLGLTIPALAERLGVPLPTMRRWEKYGPPFPIVVTLALERLEEAAAPAKPIGPKHFKLTAKERLDIQLGNAWLSYWRLSDGSWLPDRTTVTQLPDGSLYWETGEKGRWFERKRDASKAPAFDPWTGNADAFEAFEYWREEDD